MIRNGLLFCCLLLGACTWVKLTEDGAQIRVLRAPDVVDCQLVGQTTSTTRDAVIVRRNDNKVRAELQTLAQNEAAKMGGNVIVADGGPSAGSQSFQVYKC